MKTFTAEELKEVIQKHGKWLRGEDGGGRANLLYTDLRGANLKGANLQDADLQDADLRGANLLYANLQDADLQDADLRGANLLYANLRDANLQDCIGNRSEIRSIQLETYSITYTSEVMQIGCKRYKFDKWRNFNDQEIIEMDGKTALTFWRKWKDTIFTLVEIAPATPTGAENER